MKSAWLKPAADFNSYTRSSKGDGRWLTLGLMSAAAWMLPASEATLGALEQPAASSASPPAALKPNRCRRCGTKPVSRFSTTPTLVTDPSVHGEE